MITATKEDIEMLRRLGTFVEENLPKAEPLRELTQQEEVMLNMVKASGGWKHYWRRKIKEFEEKNK